MPAWRLLLAALLGLWCPLGLKAVREDVDEVEEDGCEPLEGIPAWRFLLPAPSAPPAPLPDEDDDVAAYLLLDPPPPPPAASIALKADWSMAARDALMCRLDEVRYVMDERLRMV